jgi:Domain of unknown function (DUF4832)/Domain of unknown function (DUF4874)
MKFKRFITSTALLTVLLSVGLVSCLNVPSNTPLTPPTPTPPSPSPSPTLVSFEYPQSLENFPNPERGFAFENDVAWPAETPWGFCDDPAHDFSKYNYTAWNDPLKLEFLLQERAKGRSVVLSRYHIADFRNRDLTQEYLDFLQRDLDTARQAGIKLSLHFAYNYPLGGPDAPLNIILRHIKQLQPIFTKNVDVIPYVVTGFVGCWGEWHTSSNGLNGEGTPLEYHLTSAERQILDALLESLPRERMITLRFPRQKFEYFGNNTDWLPIEPLTAAQAFDGSNRARVGHEEDCFICSESHGGSYFNPRGDLTEVPRFLEKENPFVLQAGEPGAPDTTDPSIPGNPNSLLASCTASLAELSSKYWSVLGLFDLASPVSVFGRWKKEGCHDEIERRLGYRYRLLKSEFPVQATRGKTLQGKLTLTNDGFANMYNSRMVELVLREQATRKVTRLKIFDDARLKMPFPGKTKILDLNLALPADLALGTYDVLLALPDPMPSLHDRPEYAIQLANQNIWEASTGWNNLGHKLQIQ